MSSTVPELFDAWRAYAAAVERGDTQMIEFTWQAYEQVLYGRLNEGEPIVVHYEKVPATAEALVEPMIDAFVRQKFTELREAFCISLTMTDEALPYQWDEMEQLFAAWLAGKHLKIASEVSAEARARWEAERATELNEGDGRAPEGEGE